MDTPPIVVDGVGLEAVAAAFAFEAIKSSSLPRLAPLFSFTVRLLVGCDRGVMGIPYASNNRAKGFSMMGSLGASAIE